jgi:membrane protein
MKSRMVRLVRIAQTKQIKARIEGLKVSIQCSRFTHYPPVVLIWRGTRMMINDDATHLAAGIAYYAIFSLFPLFLGFLAIIGLALNSQSLQQSFLGFVSQNLPGAAGLVRHNVKEVAGLWGALGVGSILGLIWSASAVFGAITRAMNRAWDVQEDRPFYINKLRDLGMALVVFVLFFIATSISSAIQLFASRDLGIPGQIFLQDLGLGQLALWVVPWIISFGVFLLIYRFVPNCQTSLRHIWLGAAIAAILFEASKSLFVWYLGQFANYTLVYGSLASAIALLLWIYISSLILIFGAEISSEYQELSRQGALIRRASD